jgi:hypothetical protein
VAPLHGESAPRATRGGLRKRPRDGVARGAVGDLAVEPVEDASQQSALRCREAKSFLEGLEYPSSFIFSTKRQKQRHQRFAKSFFKDERVEPMKDGF